MYIFQRPLFGVLCLFTTFRTIGMCAVIAATALVGRASATPSQNNGGASSTLHIGPGANTPCATGGCPIFVGGALNGEVNNIDSTHLDIYQNQGGASAPKKPVLLILSVPDNIAIPSVLSASLDSRSSSSPASISVGASAYNISTNSSGYFGAMTSGDVYSLLGLKANKSNSFTNYSAAYLRTFGTSVSSFGIYLFSIAPTGFAGKDLLDITLNGLPEGTFAVAYAAGSYATPFTESGMVDIPPTAVPEPGTLALFGSALLILALTMRWRKRSITPVS